MNSMRGKSMLANSQKVFDRSNTTLGYLPSLCYKKLPLERRIEETSFLLLRRDHRGFST